MPTARQFIFRKLPAVEGYVDALDALVFLTLLEAQHERRHSGGLVDIGVYFGRTYFLMRRIVAPETNVLAIDLFDGGRASGGRPARYDRFLENGRQLGLPVEEDLIVSGDSTTLVPSDVTGKVGPVRFVSVDGGHTLAEVAADARLARGMLAAHGIIAFDDTFNPLWPEVTVAVADFLRANSGEFAAFCLTRFKTYVCRRSFCDDYRQALLAAPDLAAFSRDTVDFLGEPALLLQASMGRRAAYEIARRLGSGRLSDRIYRS